MINLLYIGAWSIEKFIGYGLFIFIALVGFWCLLFLVCMVVYWLTYGIAENRGKINADVDPETVRRKLLTEQEGIELVYKK